MTPDLDQVDLDLDRLIELKELARYQLPSLNIMVQHKGAQAAKPDLHRNFQNK